MKFTEEGNINDLESRVVYTGTCCYCGACGGFCTEYIHYENQLPITDEKCFELHGACFDFCPRTFLPILEMEKAVLGGVRSDKDLGYYTEIISAKATDGAVGEKGQDGGVVTALLTYLMDKGEIDAACISKNSDTEKWKPEPFVATSKEDILAGAGSNYEQCPTIVGVANALREGYKNIAMVGLPCHTQAMRKIQLSDYFDVGGDKVKYVIGLLCTETFDRDLLLAKINEMGVKIDDVNKFDIGGGKFRIFTDKGETTEKIAAMKSCMREACTFCYDFAAELGDISVGSIGAEAGWNTVIIRSETGKKLIDDAKKAGAIETKAMAEDKIELVRKLASRKKTGNLKNIMASAGALKLLNLSVDPLEMNLLI
ncbi:MAG: Coenzyme F420 hydrogenase subunit beta [Candidatus Syntrophoarchaeum sp. GoM_oil]|nr:MAG: Coenzyme F420 hydrogenase subunit beta [Candidatus Syntrophoarchaeum sp. GoM_oil]